MNDRYSNKDVMLLLEKVEANFPVETWCINGIHVWPLLRNNFCWATLQTYIHPQKPYLEKSHKFHKIFKLLKAIRSFFTQFFQLVCHFFSIKKSDILFLSDGVSKIIFDKPYDKFCSPLDDFLNYNNDAKQSILFSQLGFLDLELKKKYFDLSILVMIAYYISKISFFFRTAQIRMEKYDEFLAFIKHKGLDKYFLQADIVKHVRIITLMKWLFFVYIKFKGVKLCYVVCYYGILGYALSLACKKANIILSDIQHGGIANCPAYHNWKKVPQNGYEIIPQKFFFWDDITTSLFYNDNSTQFTTLHSGEKLGIPCLRSKNFIEMIDKQSSQINIIRKNFSKMIFIPLQPQFYGRRDWDRLANEIINSKEDWLWWVRPHPAYKDTYGLEEIMNVKLDNIFYDKKSYSIYSILRNSNCMVTTASSSIIEAAYFNVPSLIISPTGLEDFEHYVKAGKAHYVPENQSIVKTIGSFINA